jgi:hypothetical protein
MVKEVEQHGAAPVIVADKEVVSQEYLQGLQGWDEGHPGSDRDAAPGVSGHSGGTG